jgi:hypothetical protein
MYKYFLTSSIFLMAIILGGCGGDSNITALAYDCSVFPEQETSEYILPYSVGDRFLASPHAAKFPSATQAGQFYAVDILMPIGTTLVVSRGGIVVRVEGQYDDGDNTFGHENFVFVQHDDGSLSRYFHLTQGGLSVEVGDIVSQSDPIGISGNTGNSSTPHLHFDVVDNACDALSNVTTDLAECQTIPITFRNTEVQDCGLELFKSYTAEPF